eukprot:g17737.t1
MSEAAYQSWLSNEAPKDAYYFPELQKLNFSEQVMPYTWSDEYADVFHSAAALQHFTPQAFRFMRLVIFEDNMQAAGDRIVNRTDMAELKTKIGLARASLESSQADEFRQRVREMKEIILEIDNRVNTNEEPGVAVVEQTAGSRNADILVRLGEIEDRITNKIGAVESLIKRLSNRVSAMCMDIVQQIHDAWSDTRSEAEQMEEEP